MNDELTPQQIASIMSKASLAADLLAENAGFAGEMHDRGARAKKENIRFFKLGWNHELPDEWQEYKTKVDNEADPEWHEFQRLKHKFKEANQ